MLVTACAGGGAVPIVSSLASKSPTSPDCSNPLLATRTGPHANCVSGPGPGSISSLTPAEVAALTAAQIGALTNTQIGEFTNSQLDYITAANGFYGPAQWSAVLSRAAAAQSAAPPLYIPPGSPGPYQPQGYVPAAPGNPWWGAVGSVFGGIVFGVITLPAGVGVSIVVGAVGGTAAGWLAGSGSDAYYAFFDPNTGYYEAVDLGAGVTDAGADGFSATGTYDPSTNVVTVTVVEN